jgi:hypothetical protein
LDAPRWGGVTGEYEIGSTSDALSLYAIGAFYSFMDLGQLDIELQLQQSHPVEPKH